MATILVGLGALTSCTRCKLKGTLKMGEIANQGNSRGIQFKSMYYFWERK